MGRKWKEGGMDRGREEGRKGVLRVMAEWKMSKKS